MSVADVLAAARGEKKQGTDRGAAANAGEVATPQPAEQPKAKAKKSSPASQGLPADVPGIIAYCRKTDSKNRATGSGRRAMKLLYFFSASADSGFSAAAWFVAGGSAVGNLSDSTGAFLSSTSWPPRHMNDSGMTGGFGISGTTGMMISSAGTLDRRASAVRKTIPVGRKPRQSPPTAGRARRSRPATATTVWRRTRDFGPPSLHHPHSRTDPAPRTVPTRRRPNPRAESP